jgi:hypothetical protein
MKKNLNEFVFFLGRVSIMHEVDVIASGSIHDAMQMHECCCSTSSSHFTTPITTTISLPQEQEEPELELETVKFLFLFFLEGFF